MSAVYEYITGRGVLSAEHRESLKSGRGFTDETIERLRFFSGGEYFLAMEDEIRSQFSADDLIKSGVFIDSGEQPTISTQMLDDRIIIPYLDKEGKAYFIRPHKMGLKNVGVRFYHDMTLANGIVLTEGEFKAAACFQWGIPAIAVPGVGTFSGGHFNRFVKTLHEADIDQVCIIFDNEVKDDERYPNYKPEPWKRHDTTFYAWLLATLMEKEGIECRIGMLPDSWRVNGKIDLDGALAAGRDKKDIAHVIGQSVNPRRFLEAQPEDVKKVINRKNQTRFFKSHIRREFNKYVKSITNRQHRAIVEYDMPVSNFVINFIATYETPQGLLRKVQMVNVYGDRSAAFMVSADDLSWTRGFKKACMNMGNFIWYGDGGDLDLVIEMESLQDEGARIVETDHVGWIREYKLWMAENVAFGRGKEFRPDDNGIFWVDGKGFKPTAMGQSESGVEVGTPEFSFDKADPRELLTKLSFAIGETEAQICLGWAYSVFFMEDVFEACRCFPFLFLHGKKSSGKSHVGAWLMSLYGMHARTGEEGVRASDTTMVGLQRYMAYYSGMPVFLDEYRNQVGFANKDGLLRNSYNRQAAVKGTREGLGVRIAPVRSTLIVAGQEQPRDSALISRCINVLISESNRDKENNPFEWFTQKVRQNHLSAIGLWILRNKEKLLPVYMDLFKSAQGMIQHIKEVEIDARMATNYAVVAAGYATIYSEDPETLNFPRILTDVVKRVYREELEQEESMSFWDDVLTMKETGEIRGQMWKIQDQGSGSTRLMVNFRALYAQWEIWSQKKRRDVPFSAQAIKNILKNEAYCVDVDARARVLGDGKVRGCLEILLPIAPEAIRELVVDDDDEKKK